jgi:hypothetical protein
MTLIESTRRVGEEDENNEDTSTDNESDADEE